MPQAIKGRPYVGSLQDILGTNEKLGNEEVFATVTPLGGNRAGIDTVATGLHRVTEDAVVEALSTSSIIIITGHAAKVGDVIRVKASANGIIEQDFPVKRVTANTIILHGVATDGTAPAAFAAADTIDILRPIAQRFDDSGASLAAVISPPIQILRGPGGVYANATITKDTTVPANTIAIPVEIVGAAGTEINITAGDINVQTSHAGANPDSMRIGDGTETVNVNASNELQVRDDDANTTLSAISGKLPATLGQKAMAASLAVVIASDQSAIDVNDIGGTISLPTGASTEAKQDDAITELVAIKGLDFATETTLAAMNTKLPASVGQKARAASFAVTLSSEDATIQGNIETDTGVIAGAVAAGQMQVDLVDLGGAATEAKQDDNITQLTTLNGKIGSHDLDTGAGTEDRQGVNLRISGSGGSIEAKGQQLAANSIPVILASDQPAISVSGGLDVIDSVVINLATTPVTTAGYTQLLAATSGAIKAIQIFTASGSVLHFATGAAASEVDVALIPPGGLPGHIMDIDIATATRISLKVAASMGGFSSDANSGIVLVNFLG